MASTTSVPSIWEVSDVEAWAHRVKLSDETVATLVGDQVDGPTLVILQQDELRSMLGILSLPARRHLWEIIEGLRSQQQASNFSALIESLDTAETPDESGGRIQLDIAVVEQGSDATQQRQVWEDHILALRLQDACHLSKQSSEDADMARNEQFLRQFHLQELVIRSDLDRKYAASLALPGQRPSVRSPDKVASLLDLAISDFVKNRVNVVSKLTDRCHENAGGVMSDEDIEDRANALESLPTISRCSKSTGLLCSCGTLLCTSCKTGSHNELSCIENKAAIITESDDVLFELSCMEGWKQCPGYQIVIESLKHGCSP
jgi:hypothetical protein